MHVLPILIHPQAVYSFIKRECTAVNIILLDTEMSSFVTCVVFLYCSHVKRVII